MMENFKHTSVLLDEAVNGLNIRPDGIYIDGTFGRGGHSRLILSQLGAEGRLLAIDRDPQAIAVAKTIDDPRFSIVHGPFSALADYVSERELTGKIDGILLDLGVSSPQLDDAERGFSFMRDGPLDMRMDPTRGQSAAEWLQTAEEADIAWVIKTFGEERFGKRIARAIVERNRIEPMTRTKELAEVVTAATPVKDKFKHPATRTFQAVRIWVNSELEEIEQALKSSLSVLAPGGRLSIISFHSLEDRIVKRFMREQSRGPQVPAGLPMTEEQLSKLGGRELRALGKLMPGEEEVAENPRARSSVLRIAGLHQPRHPDGALHLRPHRGHEPRPDHGGGACQAGLRGPAGRLHQDAARRGPVPAPPQPRPVATHLPAGASGTRARPHA